jgi:hypothetical protein
MRDYQKSIGYRPNHHVCGVEDCPAWDPVNGCWKDFDTYLECDYDLEHEDGEDWQEIMYGVESDPDYHCVKCFKYSELLENGKCPMCFEVDGYK